MKEETIRVKDGNLFYRFEGQGEPLILLHSLGVSSESWQHVIEPLSRNFSVYAVDLMGHGNSDKPSKNYEIYHYAENVIELMDVLKINQARIIGNSIGAMVSIEMSVSFPQRLAKQVLVGCPIWDTAWERMERLMFYSYLRYDSDGNLEPITMDGLSLFFAHPTTAVLDWYNNVEAKAEPWRKKAQIAIVLYDVVSKLHMVNCPTLIISGGKDELHEKDQVLVQRIKGAKYSLIEDAGHLPQMDAPEDFLKPVMEFL